MESRISTIIFDLGGVILSHPKQITPYVLAKTFNISDDQALADYKIIDMDWRIGRLKGKDVLEMLRKKYSPEKNSNEVLSKYKQEYLNLAVINNDLIKLIQQLRKRYWIILSTNTMDIHWQLNKERGLFDHFYRVYSSCKIGLVKPTKEYFQHVLNDLKVIPKACFFVDDKEENIEAARQQGMDVYLFDNIDSFTAFIKEKRIL